MAEEQSLTALIVSQLTELNLKSDEETVEFVQGLVEEESFLPEVRFAWVRSVQRQARTFLCATRTARVRFWACLRWTKKMVGFPEFAHQCQFRMLIPCRCTTETGSSAIDSLLDATQAYQDEVAARRKAEEEAKAPPKGQRACSSNWARDADPTRTRYRKRTRQESLDT